MCIHLKCTSKNVSGQGIYASRGVELYVHPFSTLALDGDICSDSQTGRFNPGESTPVSKWIVIHLVYRAGLDFFREEKNVLP